MAREKSPSARSHRPREQYNASNVSCKVIDNAGSRRGNLCQLHLRIINTCRWWIAITTGERVSPISAPTLFYVLLSFFSRVSFFIIRWSWNTAATKVCINSRCSKLISSRIRVYTDSSFSVESCDLCDATAIAIPLKNFRPALDLNLSNSFGRSFK